MTIACDLCGQDDLALHHEPEGTSRGIKVYLCQTCGLVQSLPRDAPKADGAARVSSGADWGNIRYGKGFRVAAHMALLAREGIAAPARVLDVGSNRGAFIEAARAAWPHAAVTAIEPDSRVTSAYENLENVALVRERIERWTVEEDAFDLVYSSHTLEHVAGAREALKRHARALTPGGRLLLEVPNIALIEADDIVEEWFIDKHAYHFSAETLLMLMKASGLEPLVFPKAGDCEYLTVLARRIETAASAPLRDQMEVSRAEWRMAHYKAARRANRRALLRAAQAVTQFEKPIAIWGAGRLFDALVTHGGLDTSLIDALIDSALAEHVSDRHGVALEGPQRLAAIRPKTILIASRGFAQEIAAEARALAPEAHLVTLAELLASSGRAAA